VGRNKWGKALRCKSNEDEEDKIGFHHVGSSQVFEKERMPLEESDDRIN
jgi:hypothetical protein